MVITEEADQIMVLDWQEIGNLGIPMVILAAVGVALWKFGWYTVHRIFGDESKNTKGIAGEWVDGEMRWRTSLTERLERQTSACEGHIETVKALGDSLSQQMEAAKRTRLLLARLVAEGCNCLLLDEPINHLDIPSRTQFEQALSHFDGAVLAVVHDRYFINLIADEIWWVENGWNSTGMGYEKYSDFWLVVQKIYC